ncbi:MAG: serine/threonine-protein kinase, partial [Myxococcota bacterium]
MTRDDQSQPPAGFDSTVLDRSFATEHQDPPAAAVADQPSESFALTPGAVVGQYELIRELGRGGMGTVFLARDVRLGRRVAIKFLAHDDPDTIERFIAEARVTARCKHDNIVVIHDVGEVAGYSYMALEYIEGITLQQWIKQRWRPALPARISLPASSAASSAPSSLSSPAGAEPAPAAVVSASRAAELMLPVVRALAHAHALGLIHRDLKPANIMLDRGGAIKVLDFGLATVMDEKSIIRTCDQEFMELWDVRGFRTRHGAIMGTIPYMSPEQWGAGDIDERSDIWAVGLILWELTCGRHPLSPFTQDSIQSIAQLDVPIPALTAERP